MNRLDRSNLVSPGNFPLGVDVGALPAWVASLKGHLPRTPSVWASLEAGAYGKATTPTAQRKPHARKFPAPSRLPE